MTTQYGVRIFHDPQLPIGLAHNILMRLGAARRRAARVRLAIFSCTLAVSAAALIFASLYVWQVLYTSGFSAYLSLVFSDMSGVSVHWQEFALSLTESFPSLAILMLVSIAAAFVWSLKAAVRDVRAAALFAQFAYYEKY